MTKKDFKFIADALRVSKITTPQGQRETVDHVTIVFADELQANFPNFNRDKFIRESNRLTLL